MVLKLNSNNIYFYIFVYCRFSTLVVEAFSDVYFLIFEVFFLTLFIRVLTFDFMHPVNENIICAAVSHILSMSAHFSLSYSFFCLPLFVSNLFA